MPLKTYLGLIAMLTLAGMAGAQEKGPPAPPLASCGVHGDIEVLCGTHSPEDLELAPDGKFLIATQFVNQGRAGTTGAGMALFDLAKKTFTKMTVTDEQSAVYFQLLDQESKKLDSILGKLLVVKDLKTSRVKIEKVDFNDVINKSLKYLKYIQDFENVNLKVQVDGSLDFHSDESLLELIFMNLIDNAIQFHDDKKPSTNIFIDIFRDNNFVTIRIKDNGIGMDESIVNQIFDMHFRGTERSTGTGLGLYIVKTAVDALNGKIFVQSKLFGGTDFIFSFPYKSNNKSLLS